MKYILNEPWCLRGWKNKPYCLCDFTSPMEPMDIAEGDMRFLSSPFEYDGGNQTIDRMIDAGMLRPAGEGEALDETRQYRNYGCLHFSSVIFSITGKCNYNCLHCSVNAPESPLGEFSFERIEELLDEMKDCGLKNIVLIGGEPLVRKDFMQIVDAVLQSGLFVVQIFTNGSLVNDALLDELDKRNISPTFMISFDGVGYHDIMRGVKGAEERFYQCVDLLPSWSYRPERAAVTPVCRVYRRELNISPDGILSPCYAIMADEYIKSNMPDINKMPLRQALTDSAFTRIIELTSQDIAEHNPKCRSCEYSAMCGGGCRMSAFEKTGDLLGYDPQMCYFFEHGFPEKFREAIRRGEKKRTENMSILDKLMSWR